MTLIGNRIANLRKNKKMTQQSLADIMYVTNKTISSWESNRTSPSLDEIVRLSDILDTTSTYLLYGDIPKLDVETEIKIKITEEEYNTLNDMMKRDASFIKDNQQKDTYYNFVHRSFLKEDIISEWLRIGERSGKIILNYKHWYDVHCDEYEVELDNKENMEKILKILGLEQIAVVDKFRKTYLYQKKYEVALDKVEKLGYFIEIEVKKYDSSILMEYDKLLKLAKQFNLNLDNIDKRGYPYYFLALHKSQENS